MNMTRISVNSNIHFGKPCISGTRITVQSVLELLDARLSFESIIQDYYPDLQVEDVRACLKYAIALVASEVHNELIRVLETYSETDLSGAFVVVEFDGHRFRRPSL
jgi:uncharacterized protein (DUF433 family)